ncbi:hypothetical protein P7K49_004489, partial [Saguinus oedipus]
TKREEGEGRGRGRKADRKLATGEGEGRERRGARPGRGAEAEEAGAPQRSVASLPASASRTHGGRRRRRPRRRGGRLAAGHGESLRAQGQLGLSPRLRRIAGPKPNQELSFDGSLWRDKEGAHSCGRWAREFGACPGRRARLR